MVDQEVKVSAPASSGWWSDAVVYQVYPRSFADSNGDGVGDLPGVIEKIPYLVNLGVDAIWLSPFYPSAGADAGYDVSDPCAIDPVFGSLVDFDRLIASAHAAQIRVIVDLVPNHTSSEHPWFVQALAAGPGSEARDRYIFRPGRRGGPPNDWESVFGGPAWTRVETDNGQRSEWYLHLYDTRQPDLNWRNAQVHDEYERVLRFWLDRGVDGFRVDVAHGLIKAEGLPDIGAQRVNAVEAGGDVGPMWDQDEVHDIYRRWRSVLEEYGPEHIMVAEAWTTADRLSRYIRVDEMHQAFNFAYLATGWDAANIAATITSSLEITAQVGATTTWVMSNHDVVRVASRLGQADPNSWTAGIGPGDPQPDLALGRRRAAAYALLTLALPGSVYIYQGEELGLPDHTLLDAQDRHDPSFARTSGIVIGRDGCRVPLPWIAETPGHGFGAAPWLPQPPTFRDLAVDTQETDASSFLSLYRSALQIRRAHQLGRQDILNVEHDGPLLAVRSTGILVLMNLSDSPTEMNDNLGEVVLTSTPDAISDGLIAPNSAAWLRDPTDQTASQATR